MLSKPVLLIFIFFTFFYIGTTRVGSSTDTIIATLLPVSIIRGNGFDLGKIYPVAYKLLPSKVSTNGFPYYVIKENGHLISAFPVFSSLAATPIYFFPVIFKNITLDNLEDYTNLILILGKISASIFSAVSVAFVFLSAKEFLNSKMALLLTVLYGLGTSTLSISSQSLWQHAASQMFLACCMYLLIKGQKNQRFLPTCGLFLGFAALSRFPNLIIALFFFVYIFLFQRKAILSFIKYSVPPFLFFVWYQINYSGNLFFHGYEAVGEIANFNNSFLKGLTGLLIAPSKGLFIYSPIFIFSIWGIIISWKKNLRILMFFSVLIVAYMSFVAKWSAWHGGWSYGPRMLADVTPFLAILLVPILKERKILSNSFHKSAFIVAVSLSVYIHLLGVTVGNFSWYSLQTRFLTLDQAHQAAFLWNWNYPEIYHFYLVSGSFFGTLKVLTVELLHITLTLMKGLGLLVIIHLIRHLGKKLKSKS